MNLFLAGTQGRRYVVEQKISGEGSVDLHLAGTMYGNQGHALVELGVLDDSEPGGRMAVEGKRDLRPKIERERVIP